MRYDCPVSLFVLESDVQLIQGGGEVGWWVGEWLLDRKCWSLRVYESLRLVAKQSQNFTR